MTSYFIIFVTHVQYKSKCMLKCTPSIKYHCSYLKLLDLIFVLLIHPFMIVVMLFTKKAVKPVHIVLIK